MQPSKMRSVVQSYMREGYSTEDAIRQARLWAERMERRRRNIAAAKPACGHPVPTQPIGGQNG